MSTMDTQVLQPMTNQKMSFVSHVVAVPFAAVILLGGALSDLLPTQYLLGFLQAPIGYRLWHHVQKEAAEGRVIFFPCKIFMLFKGVSGYWEELISAFFFPFCRRQ